MAVVEPVRFFNRTTRQIETERIYGERWVRWAYETSLGRLSLEVVAKRWLLSAYYGWQMNKRLSSSRVLPFIIEYNLDADEFVKNALEFKTFNEFFCRALKRGARPIAPGDEVAIFPADGRHLVIPDVDRAAGFYVKGQTLSLAELLGEGALPEGERPLTRTFTGGAMVISRLCPVDYHRFHFPVAGTPEVARAIDGFLYSVNPIALRRNLGYLWQNKRRLTPIVSPQFGHVAMFEIGATNVGTIVNMFVEGRATPKGEEKGLFKFGGSCVVTLFERGRIRFDDDLVEQSARCLETYARMGERLGVATAPGAAPSSPANASAG